MKTKSFFLTLKSFEFLRKLDKFNDGPISLQELNTQCWLKARICEASINQTYTYLVQAIKMDFLSTQFQQAVFAFYQSIAIINPTLQAGLQRSLEQLIKEANQRPNYINMNNVLPLNEPASNKFADDFLESHFNFTRECTNYNRIVKFGSLNCGVNWPKLTNQYFEIVDWHNQIIKQSPDDLQNFDITLKLIITPVERLELTDTQCLEKSFEISCRVVSFSTMQNLSIINPIVFTQKTLVLKTFSLDAIYKFLYTVFDDTSYQSFAFSVLAELDVYFHIPIDCQQLLLDWDMKW